MIHVRDGESPFKAIKRFTKEVQRSGITAELRQRRHYVKPSEKKRRKRLRAERQRLREAQKRKESPSR